MRIVVNLWINYRISSLYISLTCSKPIIDLYYYGIRLWSQLTNHRHWHRYAMSMITGRLRTWLLSCIIVPPLAYRNRTPLLRRLIFFNIIIKTNQLFSYLIKLGLQTHEIDTKTQRPMWKWFKPGSLALKANHQTCSWANLSLVTRHVVYITL